jgi:homoserine dehydrogenase
MSEQVVRIGLVGFGTVGAGVAKLLLEQADAIAARTGLRLQLAKVVDLDTTSKRPVTLPAGMLTSDMNAILDDKSIQVGIELIGGTRAAKDVQLKLLAAGKDVVTANKALLAEHGGEIFAAARKHGRCVAFEASCAGGIPIISAIRTGLVANNITAMYGIVNGTCNYILSNMTSEGKDFPQALKEAQAKGYAEADPTLDINGSDTAHKLAILASIAFGYDIRLEDIYVDGIQKVSLNDIKWAGEMGYVLKLLAIGQKDGQGKVWLRVHPSFISEDNALARVNGPFNAISVFGDAVGHSFYCGRGAGMMPTASAIVADIVEVAFGNSARLFSSRTIKPRSESEALIGKTGDLHTRFYIRLMAKDQPGVFAQIGRILGDNQISLAGVMQHEGKGNDNTVPVIVTTHPTLEKNVSRALGELAGLSSMGSEPVCIRIVDVAEDCD